MKYNKITVIVAMSVLTACGPGTTGADGSDPESTLQAVSAPKCPGSVTVSGIDVSEFQGAINWSAVKGAGHEFAIARISDGTGHLDPTFAANWAGIRSTGMIRGAYQYFEPGVDALAQANLVIDRVGRLGAGDLPVMLDVETTGGQSPSAITAKIHQWIDAVQAGTGKTPFIYTGAYFWDASVGTADFSNLPLNIGWYGTNCPGTPSAWTATWTMHQYSATGRVPGIAGDVDMDTFNGSLAQLQSWAGANLTPVHVACGLDGGARLKVGEHVNSCNGNFQLAMQTDGNLVEYQLKPYRALWSTNTQGRNGASALMQTDGNLVVYDNVNRALWQTGSAGRGGSALAVQDDGNLVVYSQGWVVGWTASSYPPVSVPCGLNPGEAIHAGQSRTSCDGRFVLAMQTDGNLVVYQGRRALWSTGTGGRGGQFAVMQADGNFALYGRTAALWFSGTAGHAGSALSLQTDGNLVVYAPGMIPLFQTATGGH